MGVSMITMSVVRANGAVIAPLIFLIISMIFVRIGIGFGLHPKYGADAIWWAFGVSTVAAVAMGMGYFLHGGWRKLKPNRPAIT
jgi:Na+-driven multidrug efflux pump